MARSNTVILLNYCFQIFRCQILMYKHRIELGDACQVIFGKTVLPLTFHSFKMTRILGPSARTLISNNRFSKMENAAPRPLNLSETMIIQPPILASARCAQTPQIGQL